MATHQYCACGLAPCTLILFAIISAVCRHTTIKPDTDIGNANLLAIHYLAGR